MLHLLHNPFIIFDAHVLSLFSNTLEQWKQFETDQEEFRSERSNVSDGDDGSIAKRKFFHKFFILYSAITVINAILLAIGQILGMFMKTTKMQYGRSNT